MFLFKKIVSMFCLPAPLSILAAAAGLVLLWFTKRQKTGKIAVTAAFAMWLAVSFDPLSRVLLRPLADRYPCLAADGRAPASARGVKWIVVLGGGYRPDASLASTSRLTSSALARLVEGVRLWRLLPGARLILSGGAWRGGCSEADIMAALAQELGVPRDAIVLEGESLDTKDQAALVKRLAGEKRIILVTSAYHMPRALALFRKQNLRPIPAPVGERGRPYYGPFWGWTPFSGRAMQRTRRAVREYLGLAWAKMRGQI